MDAQPASSFSGQQNMSSGMCYLTPLIGAFLADAYMGRFLVILVFSLIHDMLFKPHHHERWQAGLDRRQS